MSSGLASRRVLVVADHADIADVLVDLIALDGHRADIAPNGRAALDRLAVEGYDVILCDVNMPGLDGPGLYDALERHRPALLGRFVLVSGYPLDPLPEHVEAFVARTHVRIIAKPFDRMELRRTIEGVATMHDSAGPAARDVPDPADALRVQFVCRSAGTHPAAR